MATKSQSEKVLDFIELAGSIMDKSSKLVAEKSAVDQKCAKLIPQAVHALLENERIEPHEKEAAEKILQDPTKVLEILIKTAAHRNDSERTKLGSPHGKTEKSASGYNSLQDNYVGRRARPDETESDKAFRRKLGL